MQAVAWKLASPKTPLAGHPISDLSVERVKPCGCSSEGTGHPVMSLHKNAAEYTIKGTPALMAKAPQLIKIRMNTSNYFER